VATLEQLRQLFPQAGSDEAVLGFASRQFGMPVTDIANDVGYDLGRGSISREQLSGAFDSYQSNLYGTAEAAAGAVGLKGLQRWAQRGREDNKVQADVALGRARSYGAVDNWDDVNSAGDLGSFIKSQAISSLPYMGEMIAGGVVARGLSAGARGLASAGRAEGATQAAVQAGRAAEKSLALRGTVGGVAASYPSAVGDILSSQREANSDGPTDLLSAGVGGVGYAGLNALGVGGALAKGGLVRNAVQALDNTGGLKGFAARTGASMLRSGVEEGIGETGQEMINQRFGRMAVNPEETMFSDDALKRYKDSAIGGALVGGAFGGIGGGRRSSGYYKAQEDRARSEEAEAGRPADLLSGADTNNFVLGEYSALPQPKANPFEDGSFSEMMNQKAALQTAMRNAASSGDLRGRLTAKYALEELEAKLAPLENTYRRGEVENSEGQMGLFSAGNESLPEGPNQPRNPMLTNPVADAFGGVAADRNTAVAMATDGAIEARRRAIEQQQAKENLAQMQRSVVEEKNRFTEVENRAKGFGLKGKFAFELYDKLEQLKDSGKISDGDFVAQVSDLSKSSAGKVKKFIDGVVNPKADDKAVTQKALADNAANTTPVTLPAAQAAAPIPQVPTLQKAANVLFGSSDEAPNAVAPRPAQTPVVIGKTAKGADRTAKVSLLNPSGGLVPVNSLDGASDEVMGALTSVKSGKGSDDIVLIRNDKGDLKAVKRSQWDILRMARGVDEEGHLTRTPMTGPQIADVLVASGAISKGSRSTVTKTLNELGDFGLREIKTQVRQANASAAMEAPTAFDVNDDGKATAVQATEKDAVMDEVDAKREEEADAADAAPGEELEDAAVLRRIPTLAQAKLVDVGDARKKFDDLAGLNEHDDWKFNDLPLADKAAFVGKFIASFDPRVGDGVDFLNDAYDDLRSANEKRNAANGNTRAESSTPQISRTEQPVLTGPSERIPKTQKSPTPAAAEVTDVTPKTEPVLTHKEKAAAAWDKHAANTPGAPKFADLPTATRAAWYGYGEKNWTREDVIAEMQKAPPADEGVRKLKAAPEKVGVSVQLASGTTIDIPDARSFLKGLDAKIKKLENLATCLL